MRGALAVVNSVVLVIVLIALVQMNRTVDEQIDALATANSDSTQWALAQSDVELLALLAAIANATADPNAQLAEVRTRFDIFYSRARLIGTSPLLQSLRENPDFVVSLERVDAYMSRAVSVVDADDAALRAALPDLRRWTNEIREDVRQINLVGVQVLSREADGRRARIAETLSQLSFMTLALFIFLALSVLLLMHYFRRAQQRAAEQSQMRSRLAAMVSTSLDAVIAVNAQGEVIDFNGAAEEIFGYERREAVGRQMEDLIVPDHLKAAHQAGMERYRNTREKRVIGKGRVQLDARRKDGSVFPVELSIASADSDEGEIFVSFLRDISRRVAAEQELIKARDDAVAGEKAKSDLIAVMSHEMRTPLNGMLGTLELLDFTDHTPKDREYLDIIRASGKLLLHHVDNVLEISRADAGKTEIQRAPFSIPALIRELLESQRGVAEHRGNTLSESLDLGGQDHALGDPIRLRQVLLNLIGNAIKFTRNGAIRLEARRLECDHVEFRVTDTGIGIPPADRERIFEDFVTLDPSFSRVVGGTGLGLAIVRRLIQAMDGEVGLESTTGYGSSFWVRLPLPIAQAENPMAIPATDDASLSPTRPVAAMQILVVEDNRINRVVVKDLLEKDGHAVDVALDGSDGVERVARKSYDLVLMDISMPVMDGIEATHAIRGREPAGTHLPIVALTANAIPSERDRFLAAGLDDILVKPVSLDALRAILAIYSAAGRRPSDAGPVTPDITFDALVDHSHLEELASAIGAEKIGTLIGEFQAEMDDAVTVITEGLTAKESPAWLREKVHHAAGSAALLGAERLRLVLVDIETKLSKDCRCGSRDGHQLAEIWTETAAELRLHLT